MIFSINFLYDKRTYLSIYNITAINTLMLITLMSDKIFLLNM